MGPYDQIVVPIALYVCVYVNHIVCVVMCCDNWSWTSGVYNRSMMVSYMEHFEHLLIVNSLVDEWLNVAFHSRLGPGFRFGTSCMR